MEYLGATFEIKEEDIGDQLYIIFRVSNFSESEETSKNCLLMYMEMEFSFDKKECKYDRKAQISENKTVFVTPNQPFKMSDPS